MAERTEALTGLGILCKFESIRELSRSSLIESPFRNFETEKFVWAGPSRYVMCSIQAWLLAVGPP